MNKAISEIAAGEYIAIHHSDDMWEPQKLEKQVAFLDSHPEIGAVFSNAFIINEWPRIFGGDGFQPVFHPTNPDIFYAETQNGGWPKLM